VRDSVVEAMWKAYKWNPFGVAIRMTNHRKGRLHMVSVMNQIMRRVRESLMNKVAERWGQQEIGFRGKMRK
jgi:hypothetical protein